MVGSLGKRRQRRQAATEWSFSHRLGGWKAEWPHGRNGAPCQLLPEGGHPMDLALPPELETYVADQVRSGRFENANELVANALRLRIAEDEKDAEYFREKLRRSEEDFAAGRFVRADDAFFEAKRQRIRDRYMKPGE